MHKLPIPNDIYPRSLSSALSACGEYVYAYYRPKEFQPFYVGKGKDKRVLAHWKRAAKNPARCLYDHEIEIQNILKTGNIPHISLLAYNLEKSKESRYAVAEESSKMPSEFSRSWKKPPEGNV